MLTNRLARTHTRERRRYKTRKIKKDKKNATQSGGREGKKNNCKRKMKTKKGKKDEAKTSKPKKLIKNNKEERKKFFKGCFNLVPSSHPNPEIKGDLCCLQRKCLPLFAFIGTHWCLHARV